MGIREDGEELQRQTFREAIDALVEKSPESFVPLDTPKAEVTEVEEAPLGWITVHSTRWVQKNDSISGFAEGSRLFWIEDGYTISRRPRTAADGDAPFVVVKVPAPEGETLVSPMDDDETLQEWRQ